MHYHGFQFAGSGALIPSHAMDSKSFSLSGSIPITLAYSQISAKTMCYNISLIYNHYLEKVDELNNY